MATQTSTASSDAFYKQLGRMYGTYTGAFLGFIVLLALLEQVGVPNKVLGYLFVFFTLAVYAIIGVISRTMQVSEYYVAGRRVPALFNGMATGADWMSAASFVGMAGTLFLFGYDGIAWVLGWTGGFVLVSILVGVILSALGLDPFDIIRSVRKLIESIWNLGFDAFHWLWRYFLLGAAIVIPIWLIMRLVNAPRGK